VDRRRGECTARKFETPCLLVGDGCAPPASGGDVLRVPVAVSDVRVSWPLPGISVWTCAFNQDWPAWTCTCTNSETNLFSPACESVVMLSNRHQAPAVELGRVDLIESASGE
jgi:hypothetical protein